jgi:hypothetical protein
MSHDKLTNKLLALDYMSATATNKQKRKSVNVITITAMTSHSVERYNQLLELNARFKAVSDKCKKNGVRFSKTAFAIDAVTKALDELEKKID